VKLAKYISILLIIIVILVGCSSNNKEKTVFSEQLIYGKPDEIDLVQIDFKLESSKQFEDSSIINELFEKLKGIELRQLPVEEENKLFKEKDTLYVITLISKQSPSHGEEAKGGAVIIFSTGDIVFPDIKTMGDGRTVSYINVNRDDAKMESITSFINSLEK
jgi:hypothetical protein